MGSVRIRQAEKEEWSQDRSRSGGGLSISVGINNGVAQMAFQRGGGGPGGDDDDLDQYDWPDSKPAFYATGLQVDPSGRAWVRRHLDAGEAPLFDIFGTDAQHVGTVQLPANRRVVGFGFGTLYAVYMDEFDLNYLERYAMPL